MSASRAAFLWFCAGVGLDVQGRVLDRWIDALAAHVTWLAWLN